MATFNQDTGSGNGFVAPAVGGAILGAGGLAAVSAVQTAASDAKLGKWLSLGVIGFQVFAGNAALNNANSGITYVNQVAAGGTYAQADIVALKNGLQQALAGIQNLTPGGYTGISATTNPTTSPSVATTQTTSNNGALVLLALGIGYLATR